MFMCVQEPFPSERTTSSTWTRRTIDEIWLQYTMKDKEHFKEDYVYTKKEGVGRVAFIKRTGQHMDTKAMKTDTSGV